MASPLKYDSVTTVASHFQLQFLQSYAEKMFQAVFLSVQNLSIENEGTQFCLLVV